MNESSKSTRPWLFGWIAFACTAAVLFASSWLPHHAGPLSRAIGVAALVLSAPLMFAPFFYLKKHGGVPEDKAYHETTRVVEIGPYRLVRHPQYLGYTLLVAGFAMMSHHWVTAASALFAALFLHLQAVAEEKQCRQTFGHQYRDYAARVPRFNIVVGVFRRLRNQDSA